MNGFTLARMVRARWPAVAVIVASGRQRPGPKELPVGIPFLAKPYRPTVVIRLIRQTAPPASPAALR